MHLHIRIFGKFKSCGFACACHLSNPKDFVCSEEEKHDDEQEEEEKKLKNGKNWNERKKRAPRNVKNERFRYHNDKIQTNEQGKAAHLP